MCLSLAACVDSGTSDGEAASGATRLLAGTPEAVEGAARLRGSGEPDGSAATSSLTEDGSAARVGIGAPSTATTATQRVEEARKCTALLYRRWGIIRNVYESGTYSGGRSDAY